MHSEYEVSVSRGLRVLSKGQTDKQEQDKSSDIEQQPPFGDRK